MKFLIQQMKKFRLFTVLSIVLTSIMVGSQLWQPKLLQQVLEAIVNDKLDDIYSIGVILIGVAGVGLIAGILNTITSAKVAQEVGAEGRQVA